MTNTKRWTMNKRASMKPPYLKHNTEKEAAIKAELTKLQVDATANKDIIKQLKDQLDAMNKDIPAMLIALKAQGTELAKLKNTGAISKDTFEKRMKAAFDEKASDITDLEKKKTGASDILSCKKHLRRMVT